MTLHIEVNYIQGSPARYQWVAQLLSTELQRQFGLTTNVYIQPQPVSSKLVNATTNDSQLQSLLYEVKKDSAVMKNADQLKEWYLLLTIAGFHQDGQTGGMYDYNYPTESRNACAVFESQLEKTANQYQMNLQLVMGRTILHEIGHCLNLGHQGIPHLMCQTADLIQSKVAPGWFQNISFDYSSDHIDFVRNNPKAAKPNGRINFKGPLYSLDRTSTSSKLHLQLLGPNLESKLQYTMGDLVSLNLEISNATKHSVKLSTTLGQFSRDLKMELKGPNGKKIELDIAKGCGAVPVDIKLAPGAKRYVSINLLLNKMGYIFAETGQYHLSCKIKKHNTKSTWYCTGAIPLVIIDNNTLDKDLAKEVYSGPFLSYLKGTTFTDRKLPAYFASLLKLPSFRLSVLLAPICWVMVEIWKNRARLASTSHEVKKAKTALRKLYGMLLENEKSTIRRGKALHELSLLKNKRLLKASQNPEPDLDAYYSYRNLLIKRYNSDKIKENYENKLRLS